MSPWPAWLILALLLQTRLPDKVSSGEAVQVGQELSEETQGEKIRKACERMNFQTVCNIPLTVFVGVGIGKGNRQHTLEATAPELCREFLQGQPSKRLQWY